MHLAAFFFFRDSLPSVEVGQNMIYHDMTTLRFHYTYLNLHCIAFSFLIFFLTFLLVSLLLLHYFMLAHLCLTHIMIMHSGFHRVILDPGVLCDGLGLGEMNRYMVVVPLVIGVGPQTGSLDLVCS